MPTLPNMGLITPTAGGDSGTWDDKINAAFALVDAHDHTSGKGVAVPVSGLNINDDLPMGGFNIEAIGTLDFGAIAAPSTGSKRIFVSSADNELYWRTNAGVNVKLTNGASINTSLVGGIVGDYSTVGAEVAFDDANNRYTFKDQTSPSKKWARLASGPVRIYEYDTTETVYVEHAVAAALASSYTVTWPAALPASTQPMYISSSGAVSFAAPDKTLVLPGAAWQSNSGTYNSLYGAFVAEVAGTTTCILPIPLHTGDTIKSITVSVLGNVSADADITTFDVSVIASDGTATSIGSTSSANVANSWTTFTINLTDTTLAVGDVVRGYILVDGAGATAMTIGNTEITYTPVN
jgi:hypothetical protein